MVPGLEFSPFFKFRHDQFSCNPHYDLHSTADEPLAEMPPEEVAETPSAPLVEEEGKLGEGTAQFYSVYGGGERGGLSKHRTQFKIFKVVHGSSCLTCADPRSEPSPPAEPSPAELTELPPAASVESGKPPVCLSLTRERE